MRILQNWTITCVYYGLFSHFVMNFNLKMKINIWPWKIQLTEIETYLLVNSMTHTRRACKYVLRLHIYCKTFLHAKRPDECLLETRINYVISEDTRGLLSCAVPAHAHTTYTHTHSHTPTTSFYNFSRRQKPMNKLRGREIRQRYK